MKIRMLAMVLAGLFMASSASAQTPWDAPSFMPPRPGDDIGVYLTNRGDFSVEGIWRQTGNMNLGLRLGYIDTPFDGIITVGAETWDLLVAAGDALPVDVAWTLGIGAAFNGGTTLEVPLGLSFGLPVFLDQVTLQPYAHPRLGLFVHAVNDNTELDLAGMFDLGVDATFGGNWKFRLGATFGHRDAVGIGAAYRWTRGAVVR
jgi:hypothetical protein